MKKNRFLKYLKYIFFIALTVLIFIFIYAPAFNAPFQFDDTRTIIENPTIKYFNYIPSLWRDDPSRFLTQLSFALNYHFSGLSPLSYHIVNIIIHFATSAIYCLFLVFILKNKKLNVPKYIPLIAAAIFLMHPVQTSAVTYISQRSTLLASLCYICSVLFYMKFRLSKRLILYFYSLFFAFIGIFTKPIIVTLPLTLILCDVFFNDFSVKNLKKNVSLYLPFVLLSFSVVILLILWKYKALDISKLLSMSRETSKISRSNYLFTQFNVLMTYLRLIILPINQNLDYDYRIVNSLFTFPTYLSFLALLGILGSAIALYKKHKLISFGIFWFFITISLESSIFPIRDVIFEHRMYLPMMGCALCLCLGLHKLIKNKKYYIFVLIILIGFYCTLTYMRNTLWSDRIAFLEDVARKSPNKARVFNNLGNAYTLNSDYEKAEKAYRRAIEIKEDYGKAYNNLGNLYIEQNKNDDAVIVLKKAIELRPDYHAPHSNIGNIYKREGKIDLAEKYYRKAIEINPDFAHSYVGLGNVLLDKRQWSDAKKCYIAAIAINPDFDRAYYGFGDFYLAKKNYDLAIESYQMAIKKNPGYFAALNNIGNIYSMRGDNKKALKYYERAVSINSEYANAYFNAANSLRKLNRIEAAKKNLRIAIRLYKERGSNAMADIAKKRFKQLLNK